MRIKYIYCFILSGSRYQSSVLEQVSVLPWNPRLHCIFRCPHGKKWISKIGIYLLIFRRNPYYNPYYVVKPIWPELFRLTKTWPIFFRLTKLTHIASLNILTLILSVKQLDSFSLYNETNWDKLTADALHLEMYVFPLSHSNGWMVES